MYGTILRRRVRVEADRLADLSGAVLLFRSDVAIDAPLLKALAAAPGRVLLSRLRYRPRRETAVPGSRRSNDFSQTGKQGSWSIHAGRRAAPAGSGWLH